MTNRTNTTGSVNNPARRDAITLAILPTGGKLELQTEIATTSGTTKDFTGISSAIKKITILYDGLSTTGTDHVIIQLGDSGGFETSGYNGTAAQITASPSVLALSDGFKLIGAGWVAANTAYGGMVLTLEDGTANTWIARGVVGAITSDRMGIVAGRKALSGTLTQIRLTTSAGTETFDAGAMNIILE